MKVLFYAPGVWYWWGRMANIALRDFGIQSDIVTIGRRCSADFRKHCTCREVFDIARDIGANLPSPVDAQRIVEEFERRTDGVRAALLLGMDRSLVRKPPELQWRLFAHHVRYIDGLLDRGYDAAFAEFSDLFSLLLYYLGRERDVPVITTKASRLPGLIYVSDGPYGHHEEVRKVWRERRAGALEEKALMEAEKAVSDVFSRRFQIFGCATRNRGVLDAVRFAAGSFLRSCFYAPFESRWNYRYESLAAIVARKLGLPARRLKARLFAGFERPREGERFCFYPLHHDPDMATLVYAPCFKGQLDIIRNISYSLPAEMKLYVKEHPVSVGHRAPGFYESIKANANVRLVHPGVNTFDLLPKAEIVFTITGTVGWEAILHERPVVVFGDTFWDTFDLVRRVHDPATLPGVVDEILKQWKPDRALLLKFVAAYRQTLGPGDLTRFHKLYWPEEEPRIKTVFESMLEFLRGRHRSPDGGTVDGL